MKDSIEQLMKGWRPRQTSAELRNRIFAPKAPVAAASASLMERASFDWSALTRLLVPVAGCFLMVMSLSHPQASAHSSKGIAFLPPGQNFTANDPASSMGNNSVPVTTLEWTFGRPSSSSNDSLVRTETNTLIK